jgi:hypothetical protein
MSGDLFIAGSLYLVLLGCTLRKEVVGPPVQEAASFFTMRRAKCRG